MTRKLENYKQAIKFDGINTDKSIATSANLTVGGTASITGVATFTAAPVFTVAPSGPDIKPVVLNALVGATVVLTAAGSGSLHVNRSTSGTPSWTLPTAANGLMYTFYTASTTAGFTVTGGTIKAKTSATGTAVSGTTLTNTQATAVVGDCITLVCDGTSWVAIHQTGIFTAA